MIQKTLSWCWHAPGNPETLVKTEHSLPELPPDYVLVQNQIIALNPVDWKFILWEHGLWKTGHVPGVDGMGIVLKAGANSSIRPGTRVCYHTNLRQSGSFSYYAQVPAKALIPIPDHISNEAAAALPCPGLTAWQAMKKIPETGGRDVLVSGAGGSVGRFLTQLLLQNNARVHVTANLRHKDMFLEWGVSRVLDYRDQDWHETLKHSLGNRGLYAAFDMVSGSHAASLAPLLAYYGHLVCVQDRLEKPPLEAFSTCLSLHEIALGAMHQHGSNQQWSELIGAGEQMLYQIGRGELILPPLIMDNFDALPNRLADLKENRQYGKYLIRI